MEEEKNQGEWKGKKRFIVERGRDFHEARIKSYIMIWQGNFE